MEGGFFMWPVETYLQHLYSQAVNTHNTTYNQSWKINLKNQFEQSLGLFEKQSGSVESVILEEKDMGSYKRLRVEISTIESLKMLVYVLVPKTTSKKLPAVLAVHGHGYGSKEIVGLNPDGSLRKDPGIHKNFAVSLVEKGVVVFAPELIGFGDRKLEEDQNIGKPEDNSCYRIASQLLLLGKTLPGLRVAECRRLIDYMQAFPNVEQNNLGIMGLSGGGLVAGFVSILDDRIKATVISGYTNTFIGSIMDRRHCLDNYVPGILQYTEMPELIGLIAPRPLFIEAGNADHLFPLDQVNLAMNKLKEIYRRNEAEHLLANHVFDGGHEVCGEKSYDWLVEQISQ